MSDAQTGHKAENLALGAALTTAAFFCVALVATLAKVSGLALRALDVVAPRMLNNVLARETNRMNVNARDAERAALSTNGQSTSLGLAGIDPGNHELRDAGITQA